MPLLRNRRSRAVALFMTLLGLTTYGAAVAGLVVAAPAPAQAHAGLTGSTPEADSSVETMPTEVVLTFNEEISSPAYVVVRTPDGTTYEDGVPTIEDNTVTQAVVDSGVAGKHVVAYRVVSADGHPVVGEFEFTVEKASGETSAPSTPATSDEDGSKDDEGAAATYGTAVGVVVGAAVLLGLLALVLRRRRS